MKLQHMTIAALMMEQGISGIDPETTGFVMTMEIPSQVMEQMCARATLEQLLAV